MGQKNSQTTHSELEALLHRADELTDKKKSSYRKQVRDFARDVDNCSKRRPWVVGAFIAGSLFLGAGIAGYIGYKQYDQLYTSYENDVVKKEETIERLNTSLNQVIGPLYMKIKSIEQENPGILLNAESIIDTYTGAGGQLDAPSLTELRFLVDQFPETIKEADYLRYMNKYGLDRYEARSEMVGYANNPLTDNGRTVVKSEYGDRKHITFNPKNAPVREPWNGWFAIEGKYGYWQRNVVDNRAAYVKNVPHNGYDLYNDKDSRVYCRHDATVVAYKDYHTDGIADPYNDPLGRSIIYRFNMDDGEEIRVQLGHLDDSFDIPFEPGDQLSPGQVVGYMGETGYTTGPHVHMTYYRHENGKWVSFDPYATKQFPQGMNTLYVDYIY